jgi:hypothetical protein
MPSALSRPNRCKRDVGNDHKVDGSLRTVCAPTVILDKGSNLSIPLGALHAFDVGMDHATTCATATTTINHPTTAAVLLTSLHPAAAAESHDIGDDVRFGLRCFYRSARPA